MTSKKLILAGIIALIMSGAALKVSAQVGINTDDPKATLDIVGKPSDATMADGFIAPRLTGDQLKAKDAAYSTAQTGAVVYATNAVGTASAKTVNVTAAGYYYFDGSVWQSLKGTGGVSPSDFSFTYNPTTNVLTLNDGTNSTVINLVAGASNGLTSNNGNVQLGGNLTQNTTIDNGSNGLTLGSSTSTGDVTVYNLKVPGAKDITSGATSNASATVPLNVTGGAGQVINSMNAVLTVNNTAPLWNANQIQGKTISGTPSTTNNTLVYNGTNFTYSTANSALVKKDITTATASATATAPLTIANGTGQIVGANNATLTVNNTAPLWNANQIQSTPVSATAPANQQVLVYDGAKYTPASAWLTTGNAGTTAGTNFIGTTDNQDIVFKRNGVQIGWLQSKFTEFNFEVGNISFGAGALQMGATGNANIAIGCSALEHATNCNSNIALGNRALNKVTNRQGGDNIAIGSDAGVSLIQGAGNIFIGMSTGGSLQTGSSNIVIGSSMQASSNSVSNEITIGTVYSNSATPNTARVFSNGWNYLSDRRFKHDIKPINQGLDFVSKLKPVEFVYNNRTEKMLGFIAQDVQEVMNQENMAGYDLVTTMFDDFIGLNTTEIIPILTKAIQEQQAQINDLKAQIEELQNR